MSEGTWKEIERVEKPLESDAKEDVVNEKTANGAAEAINNGAAAEPINGSASKPINGSEAKV